MLPPRSLEDRIEKVTGRFEWALDNRTIFYTMQDPTTLRSQWLYRHELGKPGDVLVLICRGPMGAGMEEIYQITAALKHLPFGKHVAVLTDARFSGVSTGACIGHIGPEALAGGPIGKVKDGDKIQIVIDRNKLEGSIDLVGEGEKIFGPEEGVRVLARRPSRPDLAPDPALPDDTRLWAALQRVGGGTWGGCVFDTDAIVAALKGQEPL